MFVLFSTLNKLFNTLYRGECQLIPGGAFLKSVTAVKWLQQKPQQAILLLQLGSATRSASYHHVGRGMNGVARPPR